MEEQTGLCSLCTHDYCRRKSSWMVCMSEDIYTAKTFFLPLLLLRFTIY